MSRQLRHCPECDGCEGTIAAEVALEEHLEDCEDLCEQPCEEREELEQPCTDEDDHRICYEHDPERELENR